MLKRENKDNEQRQRISPASQRGGIQIPTSADLPRTQHNHCTSPFPVARSGACLASGPGRLNRTVLFGDSSSSSPALSPSASAVVGVVGETMRGVDVPPRPSSAKRTDLAGDISRLGSSERIESMRRCARRRCGFGPTGVVVPETGVRGGRGERIAEVLPRVSSEGVCAPEGVRSSSVASANWA